ncbi:MAG: metal ABC transporter substrate-binding protein [Chloroflexi bacterium]|nr:metal ABC transporter substrate-binding protein [Chloroflexota bacterium]
MLQAMRAVLAPLVLIVGLAVVAACGGGDEEAEPQVSGEATPQVSEEAGARVQVVTTTNIVADWVMNVGGEGVEVFSLVPVGADPHSFQPGARDVARISDADLVLAVGLGLEEGWLVQLVENASADPSAIVELGELIDPLEFGDEHAGELVFLEQIEEIIHEVEEGEVAAPQGLIEIGALLLAMEEAEEDHDEGDDDEGEGDDDEGEDHDEDEDEHAAEADHEMVEMLVGILRGAQAGATTPAEAIEAIEELIGDEEGEHDPHGHGTYDPHFWFDPLRVQVAVDAIAARLAELDPERGDDYRAAASAYKSELDELHGWTSEQVEALPEERRLLLTSHDSLGYFASLYDFDVVGVILSTTTEATPSASDLAELAHEIEESGVPAVFGETTVSERLAAALADESGASLVRLYSGSLGVEGSGAESYIAMVRTNVTRIVDALR